jgi:hypothetical protein
LRSCCILLVDSVETLLLLVVVRSWFVLLSYLILVSCQLNKYAHLFMADDSTQSAVFSRLSMQSRQHELLHIDQWWPLPCHTLLLIKKKLWLQKTYFLFSGKMTLFHLHEFCRQPFHYNPPVYIEGYNEIAASLNMHVPHTWKVNERPAIFYFCQNVVETLHGISGFVTDLEGSSCPRMLEILILRVGMYAVSFD